MIWHEEMLERAISSESHSCDAESWKAALESVASGEWSGVPPQLTKTESAVLINCI
jgi:hypothetical protein